MESEDFQNDGTTGVGGLSNHWTILCYCLGSWTMGNIDLLDYILQNFPAHIIFDAMIRI